MQYLENNQDNALLLEILDLAQSSFRDFPICYISFTGSFAYNGAIRGKSDVDIVHVFFDDILFVKSRFLQAAKKYISMLTRLIQSSGYVIDDTFPTEFVTWSQVKDATNGRGFHVQDNGLFLPPASDEYYLSTTENWYRSWLSQAAFGRFLLGSNIEFKQAKISAWTTIICFLLASHPSHYSKGLTAISIIKDLMEESNKWIGVGVTQQYKSFLELERNHVQEALTMLEHLKILTLEKGKSYFILKDKLEEWHSTKVLAISSSSIAKAQAFITLNELPILQGSIS